MSIIEEAARRLEMLNRAGIATHQKPLPVNGTDDASRAHVIDLDAARAPIEPARASRRVDLDLARLAAVGFVVPDSPRTRLADEFRVVKRPLLNNVLGRSAAPVVRANCIMITSSLPGEGKTFTAINLALSIAQELDKRAMLIDADVVRPSVLTRLGLSPSPGLMDVLTDPTVKIADAILRTNVDNLSLLPAGAPHARATELLASDGMRKLIDELSDRYKDRILIFDTPPLLASTESRVLATLMGQIVVVVEAERTQQSTLLEALATIESCPVAMTLLNKSVAPSESAYGYGYGHGGSVA